MKDKIITFLFLSFLFIMSILHLIIPDNEISIFERRKLASFPGFSLDSEYINKMDKYLLDHFPFRDSFRSVKANYNYKILRKLDNNKIYLKDNYIFKSEYPTNIKSIDNFNNTINKIMGMLSDNNNVYMMVIPDKNYYLSDNNFLNIDYDYIYNSVSELGLKMIDLRNVLELNDYYETDTHWKQDRLNKVVKKMSGYMNFDYYDDMYKENKYDSFYGVYYGDSAISRDPEELIYLTNDIIDNCRVKYLENDKLIKIYNLDKLNGLDSYEVYLDGASSFIEIYNDKANNDLELVIFRDSFGSSLAPLLIRYYSKVTLIDNRYINSDNFDKLIDFKNQDVLFLYSTLLINNSYSLKK